MPFPADLPVEPAVWLKKALVAERAVEIDLAVGPDLGRSDHRGEHVIELFVELASNQSGECVVEREAADQQQECDPPRGDQHHPARQAAGVGHDRGRARRRLLVRRAGR